MRLLEISGRDTIRGCSILGMVILILLLPATASAAEEMGEDLSLVPLGTDASWSARTLGDLLFYFIPNEGQEHPEVLFTCKGEDFTLYFTKDRLVYSLFSGEEQGRVAVMERFSGGNPGPVVEGIDPLEARVSYFTGDLSGWHTNITPYGAVVYRNLYPGIDMIYRGERGALKREFFVAPGADPGRIKMVFEGASRVRMTGDGGLVITAGSGEIRETAPSCYQEQNGKRMEIPCRFDVRDDGAVSFYIGHFDPVLPLIIDPQLAYCGYIGGDYPDYGYDIAVDSEGNVYVVGETDSMAATFPETSGSFDTEKGSDAFDAFVAKVNPAGTALVYCGYIGGDKDDTGYGIAVDSVGNAYITGCTLSNGTTFPVSGGPDLIYSGGTTYGDAFVAKVNRWGTALLYCGYIGGSGEDKGRSIAVDTAGNAYITGSTTSTETMGFPVTGGPDLSHGGIPQYDAFVARVNTAGNALDYCGYIGGSGSDYGNGIAVDLSRYVYVTGYTESDESTFPVKIGPDMSFNGDYDAFVAKVNLNGAWLNYCGYIGGSGDDRGWDVAVENNPETMYIVGETDSTVAMGFPAIVGPDLTYNGGEDAFVAEVSSGGVTYCGYIGGSGPERGESIAVDKEGNAYITGLTNSTAATFPETVGPDLVYNGGYYDGFIAKIPSAGNGLNYCGYIGGSGSDYGKGIAVDTRGNVYITGETESSQVKGGFPVTSGSLDTTHNGNYDAFVAKYRTIDTIGLFRPSTARWYLDYDNNGLSNYQVSWGASTDIPITGDWDNDGFNEIGLFRPSTCRWYLDYDNNGLSNYQVSWGASTDIPLSGDWDNDGYDEIGLFRPSTSRWYLDYDNNGLSDYQVSWGESTDIPLTGDWDNDGYDEIGLWRPSTVRWYLDYDNNGLSDYKVYWGASTDLPITGDWDDDGYDEIGLFRPSTSRWYLDYENNGLSNYQVTWGASTDRPGTGKWV